jgi:hypothetical protein
MLATLLAYVWPDIVLRIFHEVDTIVKTSKRHFLEELVMGQFPSRVRSRGPHTQRLDRPSLSGTHVRT